LNTDARVAPEVLRICASSQSHWQPDPEHRPSVLADQYQKLNVAPAGTVTVWLTELSPPGSLPDVVPSRAEEVPLCGLAVVTVGTTTPLADHDDRPLSKPPLNTDERLFWGVTAFDTAEGGPAPFGFVAVTVNV
jgi:hypothetical protein